MFKDLFLVSILLLTAACSAPLEIASKNGEDGQKVRVGDIIEITFETYPEFDQTVMVRSDGTISLPILGELQVADLPKLTLETMVLQKYHEVLPEPVIRLQVHERTKFNVYIGGEIQKPGIIKFKGDLTIVQGILLAGGLKDRSAEYEAVIFRDRGDEGVKMFRIRIRKNDTENRDFKLAPYDVVFVLKPSSEKEMQGKLI